MISLKSPAEIEQMRTVGQAVADVLFSVVPLLTPGVSTQLLADHLRQQLHEANINPLFLGYPGNRGLLFSDVCCVSVNDELSHGVPGDRQLNSGDLITIDIGGQQDQWCIDTAQTWGIGSLSDSNRSLLASCESLLQLMIERMETCSWWSEVIEAVTEFTRESPFRLIENFPGHGIGRELHEEPQLPLTVSSPHFFLDVELQPGLVAAIEPMLTAGSPVVSLQADGWTIAMQDRKNCVHLEHTVALTENGAEILSLPRTR